MLYQYLLAQILLLVVTTNAALNEPCVGAAGAAGESPPFLKLIYRSI